MNALQQNTAIAAIVVALFQLNHGLLAQELTFNTVAGGSDGAADGINTNAEFSNPVGLVVDALGNVYVADQNNNGIRLAAPAGTNWVTTTISGDLSGDPTGVNFNGPAGVAIDSLEDLYVSDEFNGVIRMMTAAGTNWDITTIAGTAGNFGNQDGVGGTAKFAAPTGIAVDAHGNIFVTDTGNNSIREISSSNGNWVVTTIAGGSNGSADGTGTNARFSSPAGIALDVNDRLYVADQFNNTIRMVSPVGTNWLVTTIAGNTVAGRSDGSGTNATFYGPVGITVDSNNNIYVADALNCAIRKLTYAGETWNVSTVAGGSRGDADGTGTNAMFNAPAGVAADSYGNIFVADSRNNAIRLGQPVGSPPPMGSLQVTLNPSSALTAGAGWSLDGGPYQTNDATVTGIAPGIHGISFAAAAGFTTPALVEAVVTAHQTTEVLISYATAIANAGSIEVLLSPDSVGQAGAQWAVDGGPWQTNGAVVAGLSVGSHLVSFNSINDWTSPSNETVYVTNSQTTLVTGVYVLQAGTVRVVMLPPAVDSAGAGWRLDGGSWHGSAVTLAGVVIGNHTISFNSILGWISPSNMTIAITNNEASCLAVAFTQAGPPELEITTPTPRSTFEFNVYGMVGSNYVIERSTDLRAWTAVATNLIPGIGFVQVSDAGGATNAGGFYRAVLH